MDLSFTKEDLAFQKEVRDWIAENYTDELKARNAMSKNGYLDKDGMLEWQRKLDEKGWFVANQLVSGESRGVKSQNSPALSARRNA